MVGWTVIRNDMRHCYCLKVGGYYVLDGETGRPAEYVPPRSSREAHIAFEQQFKRTAERLAQLKALGTSR